MPLHECQYPGSIGPNCFAEDMDDFPKKYQQNNLMVVHDVIYYTYYAILTICKTEGLIFA